MRLTARLTLLFLALSIVPLAAVACLAYRNGKLAIEQDAFDHLASVNALKEDEFQRWVSYCEHSLRIQAGRPLVQQLTAVLLSGDPQDPKYEAACSGLLVDRLPPALEETQVFLDLSIVRVGDGLAIVSADQLPILMWHRDTEA